MRLLILPLVFFLSVAVAHADSSCTPLGNSFHALTKVANFTVFKNGIENGTHREIIVQGRPDGIYEPTNDETPSFRKKWERSKFSTNTAEKIEQLLSDEFKCQLVGEEIIDGKIMQIFNLTEEGRFEKEKTWIGKDDGRLYRFRIGNREMNAVVYEAQK